MLAQYEVHISNVIAESWYTSVDINLGLSLRQAPVEVHPLARVMVAPDEVAAATDEVVVVGAGEAFW